MPLVSLTDTTLDAVSNQPIATTLVLPAVCAAVNVALTVETGLCGTALLDCTNATSARAAPANEIAAASSRRKTFAMRVTGMLRYGRYSTATPPGGLNKMSLADKINVQHYLAPGSDINFMGAE